MTLDDVSTPADQEFELCEDVNGELEYPVRAAKFSGALGAHTDVTGARQRHQRMKVIPTHHKLIHNLSSHIKLCLKKESFQCG